MRFPRDAFLSKLRKNQIRPKKKQKKLDAICERTYIENRVKIESPGLSQVNGDPSAIRRKIERDGDKGHSGSKADEPCSNSVGVEEEE
ncbi:hypothetical protein Tco_1064884 [Tanacetum coccineum]